MAEQQLRELGEKLESPPSSKDELVELLKKMATALSEIEQSPRPSVLESLNSCFEAFSKPELLKHEDSDVKVLVATCICEITRITAPEAPYSDDVLRDMFELIVGTFSGLNDSNSSTFSRRVAIVETLARYRSCVVMLDLDCNDLINEMFHTFFSVVSDDHSQSLVSSMQTIMVVIIEESEEIQENLLLTILSALGRKNPGFSLAARRLAKSVVQNCVEKLESPIKQFLVSSISGEGAFLSNTIDHHEVIFDLYQCGPQILTGIVPFITGELLTDKLEVRSKAVELIGELISLPGVPILESFQPLFSEFLKRLTDRVVDLRISVIEHLKNCLISHPSRPEASQIIQALCDRLLDFDENVRKKVVAAICDVAHHEFDAIQAGTIELVAKRLRDTSISVKKYTMERLSDMYRLYCEKSTDSSKNAEEFEWIPGKILKCLYDKDFRPETIEHVMIDYFPSEFSVKDRAKHWIRAFSGFDKIETKALEQILLQKQRLQQEVQKYLTLRQTPQEEAPDLQKRIAACFRSMSRLFHDHSKAEESLNALNQLKDANVWKLLSTLLDPATPFQQARSTRDELLKIIEEKHPLHEFMSMLSVRCSYLLINKEHVKEFLSVASEEKSSGNIDLLSACMNLLTVIASFFPLLFAGSEESLVNLIKEDNEILKEGIAHVLAKAGGIIREELATTSSSIDLILERLCLEGSRKQAKYSVHALAAVTKDDGLKSLSVLYKRIVDTLEEKVHLPSALQSLGCIAQIAMPIFETREEEIVGFLNNKILENSNKADEVSPSPSKSEWGERSELCSLKIYALKTLVNSYLPSKDAHARKGIEKLLGLLKNILSYGDVSPNMFSSTIDKAHLRLASAKAVLRLSRQWDAQIPTDVFYLTLRISQDENPQSRKIFLGKVHQYIKERVLDAKYACAYLLNISKYHLPEYEECKHNLLEVVQICQQVKIRQLSVQADMNLLTAYPEYILAYLVHALAHDPFCPKFEEGTDIDAFGPLYWRLSLFLSVLLVGDESTQGGSAPNKENYSTVVAILHSIKSSQDLVDADKTRCLHAISDLGLVIAKRLVPDGSEISQTQAVPLPTQLYTTPEKSEQENGTEDEHTWSAAEGVVAHFEALKVEEEEMIDDQSLLPVTDGYGNELPLGKMLKIIKAQGAKRKKEAKKEVKPKDPFEFDGDDDVLGLVREINSESMDGGRKKELVSKKRQIEKGSASSTPKKKRSVPVYQSPQKKTEEKKSIKTEKDASKRENMSSASTSFNEKNKSVDARSSNGSVNKRKRESFLGLEKCSTKGDEEDPEEELVGKRIKVWWPLDKQYYHGMVGSYDASKKKHTILYDDGDKEVLNLGKQKWKLLSSDSSAKRQKVDQKTTPKDSLEKKRDPTTQSASVLQKGPTKKSPPSKKKGSSGRPRGRPKKTTSGSATKDGATEDPADDSDADVDRPNDDGTKDKKEEEPVAESWEKSGDGEKQSDDEDEPLSTWKANLTKVK